MIFAVLGHIDMIRNGLDKGDALARIDPNLYQTMPLTIIKTQTRRLNRGIYKVGKDYAVQRKRGVKAEPDIRIVIDMIWEEEVEEVDEREVIISKEDAWAEGGYTPTEFEDLFADLNLEWLGWSRWAFEFHVIEVQRE